MAGYLIPQMRPLKGPTLPAPTPARLRLKQIEDCLDQALFMADAGQEILSGVLISEARDAVTKRYLELPPEEEH